MRIQERGQLVHGRQSAMVIKRSLVQIAVLFLTVPPGTATQSPVSAAAAAPVEPSALLERVLANQKKGEEALEVYERIERSETRKNRSDDAPVSVKIARVIPSGTGMDKIPVGADGKPSDAGEYRARLEGLERALTLVVKDNRSQHEAVEKYAKRRKDRLDLIDATRTAFIFTFVGHEPRGQSQLAKYEMTPNPAFKPTSMLNSIFRKVHGFVWIDENAAELARIEGDVTGDISIGLFLGKIYKGSHFMQERYEVLPGLWEATFSQYDFEGRKFFSGFSIHERTFYSNYRYIGAPKEALAAIRRELEHADLGKPEAATAVP